MNLAEILCRNGLTLLVALILVAPAGPLRAAEESAEPAAGEASGKLSLIDAAPEMLWQMKRLPKYYGDPNLDAETVDGGLFERQYLLGSLGGSRTWLAEHGVFVDIGVTQVLQGAAEGDGDDDVNYVGSGDAWLGLDTGRLGLWPAGMVFAHLEGSWGDALDRSGALLPVDADSIMPGSSPASVALSELYLSQALSPNTQVFIGKGDWAAFADTSFFANSERTQFLNEGLVNNPLLGAFVPYTSLGALAFVQSTDNLGLAAAVIQNAGQATEAAFDDLGIEKSTFALVVDYTRKFGELPGSYQVLAGYTTLDAADFGIDERYLIEEILGLVPVREKDGNYAVTFTASQYLWVWDGEGVSRQLGEPNGLGLFFRFGIAPEDRNVIDQFYSVGLGGLGGPCGRLGDRWGVGWAGSHISDNVRDLADDVSIDLNRFEHVIEAFYAFEITPAVHLSLDFQQVLVASDAGDDLTLFGTRLQIDF